MSHDGQFDRIARSWLETGPTQARDDVVEHALLTIRTTPQERDVRVSWRLPTMNMTWRLVAALAIAVLAVGGGVAMLRPNGATVGLGPSAVPTSSSPATSPSPSPAATGPASAPAAVDVIPEGTYVGPTIQVADIVAFVDADKKLTSKEKASVLGGMFGVTGHQTWTPSLEFNAGRFTQRQNVDGTVNVGSRGTYSFIGNDTLAVKESCCGLTGFTVTRVGNGFTLTPLGPPLNENDKIAEKFLFGSGPFVPAP
jgi:hypothetical protein